MKKNILLTVFVIACMAVTLPAFAEKTIDTANTTQIGGANFVPSTNVSLSATASDTAYSVTSVHNSSLKDKAGRMWASYTAGASAIYYKSCDGVTALTKTTSADALAGNAGDWTPQ